MNITFLELPNPNNNIVVVTVDNNIESDNIADLDHVPIAKKIKIIEVDSIKYKRKINYKLLFHLFVLVSSIVFGIMLVTIYNILFGYVLFIFGLIYSIFVFFCLIN